MEWSKYHICLKIIGEENIINVHKIKFREVVLNQMGYRPIWEFNDGWISSGKNAHKKVLGKKNSRSLEDL